MARLDMVSSRDSGQNAQTRAAQERPEAKR
jgi:hypothetical protein